MSEFRVKVINTINDIDSLLWDEFFDYQIENRYFYFKTLEESEKNKVKFYYILFYKETRIIAIVPLFILSFPIDISVQGYFKKITEMLKKVFPRLLNIKTVFIGNINNNGGIGIDKNISNIELLFKKIIVEINKIAKEEKALLINFKDFSVKYANIMKKNGFSCIESYPNTKLEIKFKNIEEYLKNLSHATRYDMRRKIKQYSQLPPLNLEIKNNCSCDIDLIYELYLNTVKNNDLIFEIISKDFFINLTKNMPKETFFFIWKLNGKIVSFEVSSIINNTMLAHYIGFDYEILYKYNLYFITFLDRMDWCIKNNIRYLKSGGFGYEPKKRLKFDFERNFFYMKPCNRILEPFFKLGLLFFKPENQDKDLKFLKKMNKI
ncbi:MAG: GNAT family N-acetyltransferase [Candidatus Omnitrophota bacterium]